ncbi:MAG TPA: hypothetical protein VGA61_16370 [Anaerolineae bacterium]
MVAFFENLVETDEGQPVTVSYVGAAAYYVIDDQGFRRHVEARPVDRIVLAQFLEQLHEHQDEASTLMLQQLGSDDLFTKAMVDSTLRNLNVDQILDQGLPPQARQWLGMLGFRIVLDRHGEVARIEMPSAPEGWQEGE